MERTRAQHFKYVIMLVVLALLVLSGCGGRQQTPAASGSGQQATDSEPTQSTTSTPATPSSTPPQELPEVTFGLSVDIISYAPIYVAAAKDFFREEGVNVRLIYTEGTGPAVQALVGGSVQFISIDPGGIMQANEKGIDFIAVESLVNKLTMDFVLSNEVIERTGIQPDAPIEERFKALNGLTIGITSAGAPTDLFTRYYLGQAGLVPEKDAQLLAVGGGPSLAAAMKQGQIAGFMLSPPQPQIVEAEGYGKVFISGSAGDVPGMDQFPYLALTTRRSYMESNPDIVRAVARALARGNNFVNDYPEETLEILQDHYKNVEPHILEASFASVAPAINRDGLMTEQGWINSKEIFLGAGTITGDLDTKEGLLWTNEFVKDVNGKSK